MKKPQKLATPSARTPNLERHRSHCRVCAHPDRDQIEIEYVSWFFVHGIVTRYKLGHRSSLDRHVLAFGLRAKRARNLRAALEIVIERAQVVDVDATVLLRAIELYAKLNQQGEFREPTELVGIHEQFAKMSREELEAYARDGVLPPWFTARPAPDDSEEA